MRYTALASVLLTSVAAWFASAGQTSQPTIGRHEVHLNGHTFTLPDGFEIELAAGPPLVDRPIVADFDEQGRLYVADSSGSNERVTEQLRKKPHRVMRLEDTDGDGRFDKSSVFADQLMFPEGTMWYAGSLYVSAPPSIWKLTDTKGTGVADTRTEWFQGKTLTNCANDLHGPYLGPDGWIYWTKGAPAKQTYERPGRRAFVTRASHIFRSRPDGTGIEPVMTGGMDNPVDVVWTPGGERVLTTTFLQRPEGGRRDGLIHDIYGGIYGKFTDALLEHPWTSPALMPVLTHLGPAAPSGLARYESDAFGPEYKDNLFAAVFNQRRVSRHVLTSSGATFTCRDEDFLVSDNRDFHPTDVQEDADGSLLVVDTGGWYKLCCPTSQLHKPDILGAIYRVRRSGAPRVDDPRGRRVAWTKLAPDQLATRLDDARPVVRKRATAELAARGAAALPTIQSIVHSGRSPEARRNAVWAATRIDSAEARAVARVGLADADETVRQVAGHSVSLWRDREAVGALLQLLHNPSAHNQRVAAEALGRIGDKSAVPALLEAAGHPIDRIHDHSVTYALIEIADREGTTLGLKSSNPLVRRAALVALDQMEDSLLTAETVAAELNAKDALLKETAVWIAGRHPEWGEALGGYLRGRLEANSLTPAEAGELAGQLARFAKSPGVQAMLTGYLAHPHVPQTTRIVALRAMAQAGLKETPEAWSAALAQALLDRDTKVSLEAVATLRALPVPKERNEAVAAALLRISGDAKMPDNMRLTALATIPGGPTSVDPALFDYLTARLSLDEPVANRGLAAEVMTRARLTPAQQTALADVMKGLGPMEVNRLLAAFEKTTDEGVGLHLLAALKASPARAGLRAEAVKSYLAKYSVRVHQEAEALYGMLNVDADKQRAKLEQLLGGVAGGDIRRGQAVFNSSKATCSSCHAVGYVGGKVGPDLTRIGSIRTERDLLESIVFPSMSFVRGYEPVVVTTKKGKSVSGVLRRETADEVVVAINATEEVRVPRDEVEDLQPGKVSIMPAGLDQQLTPQDLADLVAFLKACK
jgi:putative membrane-bound dehydrogenase-like protein